MDRPDLPRATPRRVTVDGHRLECSWYEPAGPDDRTLVFLHEGLGSISQWRDFPAALCSRTGYGGLVYNRYGYGGSDALEGPLSPRFMHREALEVLPRLLETFDIARPILVGHSDGGSIALIYAGSGGPAPDALVVEAPHVFVEDVTVERIAEIRHLYGSGPLRARLARHHGAQVDRLFEAWTQVWLSADFRGWNIEQYLPAITSPTLVIQGRDDEYGTLRQVKAIEAAIPAPVETLVLDGCRHAPHVDQRAAVEAAVLRFLALRTGVQLTR